MSDQPVPADDCGVAPPSEGMVMLWERNGRIVSFVFVPAGAPW